MKISKNTSSSSFKKYNALVHPQRREFMLSSGINFFMTQNNPRQLHAFLIVWTALGIKMTEQVESWIKRAGESCELLNFKEVGTKLKYHATQEADHDILLVNDLKILLKKWNVLYSDNLTEADIGMLGLPQQTTEYINLHENTISGAHPYTQVATEFEIERISVMYGPKAIENIIYILGEEFESAINFLADHVLLDQGHTKFNIDLMEKCFTANGDLNELVITAKKSLKIYAGFLNDCVELSSKLNERSQWISQATI